MMLNFFISTRIIVVMKRCHSKSSAMVERSNVNPVVFFHLEYVCAALHSLVVLFIHQFWLDGNVLLRFQRCSCSIGDVSSKATA